MIEFIGSVTVKRGIFRSEYHFALYHNFLSKHNIYLYYKINDPPVDDLQKRLFEGLIQNSG